MDLDVIKARTETILKNHVKHGLVGEETLKNMKAGADIVFCVIKWESEKEANHEPKLSKHL